MELPDLNSSKHELHSRISALGSKVTTFDLLRDWPEYEHVAGSNRSRLQELGIKLEGNNDCSFLLNSSGRSFGYCRVLNIGTKSVILLGKPNEQFTVMNIRFAGNGCTFIAPDLSRQRCVINDALFRSNDQLLFFGVGSTSVGCSVELHGPSRIVAVGDDSMISSGIWVRNYDMHTIFDIETGEIVNGTPVDTIVERHVWLGQDAILLSAERIGEGSIIGARSMVRGVIPGCTLAAGVPARIIRRGVGWSRTPEAIAPSDAAFYRSVAEFQSETTTEERR